MSLLAEENFERNRKCNGKKQIKIYSSQGKKNCKADLETFGGFNEHDAGR